MNETIQRQFSWASVWDRTGRVVVGSVAYMTGIGGVPAMDPVNQMQWLGLAGVVAACIWTGKGAK